MEHLPLKPASIPHPGCADL